jgi:phosphoserine aminotransferase
MQVIKDEGGLAAVEKRNMEKARILYAAMDGDADFYRCPVEKESRSVMNPVFNLPSEDLEKKFVKEAEKAGMVGLKGHRSVGGIRASMYNAMTVEGVQTLVDFMAAFKKTA